MFWTVIAIFEVLGLITAVHAIMSVRTPQGTIAWVAALVTIAPVSVPAYWVFGRNKFHGYVLAREQELGYLDGDLPPDAQARVDQMTRRLVRRLLGRPTGRVVKGAEAEDPSLPTFEHLKHVFGLDEDPDEGEGTR